jgi:hypothetical protein
MLLLQHGRYLPASLFVLIVSNPASSANLHIYADTVARTLAIYNRWLCLATQTDMPLVQTEPLRPQLFITRQNGAMIPLVALDELPSTISIRGVPRTLSPHDISGMTGVGTFNSRHRQYVVDNLNKGFDGFSTPGDRSLMGSSFATPASRPLNHDVPWGFDRVSVFPAPPKAYGIQEQPPSNPNGPFANMPPSTPEPFAPSTESDLPLFHNLEDIPIGRAPGIKEYCSYWLRHGECDYAQQGCLYRHEVPLDRSTLEKLGLRDIPRWYREKHRLGSYLAGGSTMSSINPSSNTKPNLMGRNWRSHPIEASLDGTIRQPEKSAELPTMSNTSPTGKGGSTKPSASHSLPPEPAVSSPKPVVSNPKPVTPAPKPNHHAILSQHQPSPTAAAKAKAATTVLNEETVSARQLRETIRMLDAYDQRERDRLSEKYQSLALQKSGMVAPANTPSTSRASSMSGGAEVEEMTGEAIGKATGVSESTEPLSGSTSTLPFPKLASLRQSPVLKKRAGNPKRRVNNERDSGCVVNGRKV